MTARRRKVATIVLVAATVSVLALLAVQQVALRDLREVERSYLAGREVTACANARLVPYVDDPDRADLDTTVEALVVDARDAASAIVAEYPDSVVAVPAVRRARTAVARALRAEVALYEALIADPHGSDDDLRRLGRANRRAEQTLASARRWLLVGEPAGWDRRFECGA